MSTTVNHKDDFYKALGNHAPNTDAFTLDDFFSLPIETFFKSHGSNTWLKWIERVFKDVLVNPNPNREKKEKLLRYLNAEGEFEGINILYTCICYNSVAYFDFFLRVGLNPQRKMVVDEDWTGIAKYTTTIADYAQGRASIDIQKLLLAY